MEDDPPALVQEGGEDGPEQIVPQGRVAYAGGGGDEDLNATPDHERADGGPFESKVALARRARWALEAHDHIARAIEAAELR